MEAAKIPGLYAIGEAVDVTGWLGGYNFPMAPGERGGGR
jgi:predicted flavoprotein YhiN